MDVMVAVTVIVVIMVIVMAVIVAVMGMCVRHGGQAARARAGRRRSSARPWPIRSMKLPA